MNIHQKYQCGQTPPRVPNPWRVRPRRRSLRDDCRGGYRIFAILVFWLGSLPLPAQQPGYVQEEVLHVPEKDKGNISNLPVGDKSTTRQYIDGLGRTIQTVARQASPKRQDVVQPVVYDRFGRQPVTYLPYARGSSGAYHQGAVQAQANWYSEGFGGVASENPRAVTVFEASPSGRVLEQGAPGKYGVPDTPYWRPARSAGLINQAGDSVQLWRIGNKEGDVPVRTGEYAAGSLLVSQMTDENGYATWEYIDKAGMVVLKRVYGGKEETPETYYVYDDFGQLRYILPPLAVYELRRAGWDWQKAKEKIGELVYYRHYDAYGRLTEDKAPGAGAMRYVYDRGDRVVFTQDARQRAGEIWLFTKYDALERPVLTGMMESGAKRSRLQEELDKATEFFEQPNQVAESYYYSDEVFPSVRTIREGGYDWINDARINTVTYYDDYDWNNDGQADVAYNPAGDAQFAQAPQPFDRVKGRVTGSRVRRLDNNEFLTTVSFYDEYGRVIQTTTDNHRGGQESLTTEYDFAGQVLRTLWVHTARPGGTHTVLESYDYDHAGRLLTLTQRIDGAPEQTLATYQYNERGQLSRKYTGPEDGQSLQRVDYGYHLRGWLRHINTAQRYDSKDLWGMELIYDEDFRRQGAVGKAHYNGNIAGIQWQSASDGVMRSYAYEYDPLNRLKNASYAARAEGATNHQSPWDREVDHYSVKDLRYDLNGNLTHLKRYGLREEGRQQFGVIDDLHYAYEGNQLTGVDDLQEVNGYRTGRVGDFSDYDPRTGLLHKYSEGLGDEYDYDENGSLRYDRNTGVEGITYNYLNRVREVRLTRKPGQTGENRIRYTYDAAGVRLRKEVFEDGSLVKTLDYHGGMVYEDGELQYIRHAEGRALAPNTVEGNTDFLYEYHYTDHLGNLRMAYRKGETRRYTATMELGAETAGQPEGKVFGGLDKTRDLTKGHRGGASARVNQAQPLGPYKEFAVRRGDQVDVEVFAHYTQEADKDKKFKGWGVVLSPSYGKNTVNGQEYYHPVDVRTWNLGISVRPSQNKRETLPHAYLRLVFYDKKGKPVREYRQWVSEIAKEDPNWIKLRLDFEAETDGRVRVLVANESDNDVWFDDFTLTHQLGMVVQEHHYYPFGLDLAGLQQQGMPHDRNTFMGVENTQVFDLPWTETDFRTYDKQLGRFHQVDPLAAVAPGITPYRFGFNNPIAYTDPMGLFDWYANADGGIEYRKDIKSQADLDRKGIKGEYLGTEGKGVNEAGDWISFNADGSTSLTGTPMLNAVTITGTQSKSEKNMAAAHQLGIYSGHSEFFGGVAGVGHGSLDLLGMIPGLGEAADLTNAGLYALQGDYSNALIGLGAAIPIVGMAATASKYAKFADEAAGVGGGFADDIVRVRHHTSSTNLKKIKKAGYIRTGGHSPAPYGVDVEVGPNFGNPKVVSTDVSASHKGAYIEFDIKRSELVPIPGTGTIIHKGWTTGRLPLGSTAQEAVDNPLLLNGRNPKFKKLTWW